MTGPNRSLHFDCVFSTDSRMRSGLASSDFGVRGEGNSRDGLPSPRPDHLWAWRLTRLLHTALQRLSFCSGTAHAVGSASLGLTLQSHATPPHTKGKGYCCIILFCPHVSSPQAWGLCCVNSGLVACWPAVSDVLKPMTLCLSLKPQWPTIRGRGRLARQRGGHLNVLNVKDIRD